MKAHYVLLVLLSPVSLLAQAPSGQKPDFSALRHEVQLKIANGGVPGLAVGVASGRRRRRGRGVGLAGGRAYSTGRWSRPCMLRACPSRRTSTASMARKRFR